MNAILRYLAVPAGLLLCFARCSKPGDYHSDYLRGKIDGAPFACTKNIRAQGSDHLIEIYGEWESNSVKLEINEGANTITTGDYFFEDGKYRVGTVYTDDRSYRAGSGLLGPLFGSGKINISKISKEYIKGSFDFTTPRVWTGLEYLPGKTVTNGEFYIKRAL